MRMEGHVVMMAQYNVIIAAAALLPSPVDADGNDVSSQHTHAAHPFMLQLLVVQAVEFYKKNGHDELEINTQTWNALTSCLCRCVLHA